MLLAQKFGMTYVGEDGKDHFPYIIHRTSIGCYERTLALLLEKYAGALPTWLMPTQAMIIPISEKHHDYAQKVLEKLQAAGIRVEADWRSEKMGYKIREAQLKKIPYMLVVGEKEAETDSVSVRTLSLIHIWKCRRCVSSIVQASLAWWWTIRSYWSTVQSICSS